MVVWITTVRGDGQPQTSPVWFLWEDGRFLIYSQPGKPKVRNIEENPRISLNLDGDGQGSDIVVFEGEARIAEDRSPAHEVPLYVEKYREHIASLGNDPPGFARSYSVPIEVTATRVRAH